MHSSLSWGYRALRFNEKNMGSITGGRYVWPNIQWPPCEVEFDKQKERAVRPKILQNRAYPSHTERTYFYMTADPSMGPQYRSLSLVSLYSLRDSQDTDLSFRGLGVRDLGLRESGREIYVGYIVFRNIRGLATFLQLPAGPLL